MKITDVTIKLIKESSPESKLKGIAVIIIDDCFVVHGIKIIQGVNGLFIAMPSRKDSNGEFYDIAYPINSSTREMIQKAILDKYNSVKEED